MVILNTEDIWRGCLGGAILSFATSLNLLLKGRITGFSGIFYGLITFDNIVWRLGIITGMIFISSLYYTIIDKDFYDKPEEFLFGLSFVGYAISGLMVGFGTKLSNGCTSGHGLCGIPRLSRRSFIAVGLFMITAVSIATLRYNFPFLNDSNFIEISVDMNNKAYHIIFFSTICFIIILISFIILTRSRYRTIDLYDFLISLAIGCLSGLGLIISGMNSRRKVLNFLTLNEYWNPQLMFVMGIGVFLNFIFFYYIINKIKAPLLSDKLQIPVNNEIDKKLVIGSIIFGVGWGISGICPGPAIITFFIYLPHVLSFMICLAIGQYMAAYFMKMI